MTSTTNPDGRNRFRRRLFSSLNRDQSDGSSASQSSSIPSTNITSKIGNQSPPQPTDRNIFKGAEILRNQLLSKHKKERQPQQRNDLSNSNHSYSAKDVQAVQADLMMSTKRRGNSNATPKTISDDDTSLWSEDDPWANDPWRNKRAQQQQQSQGSGGHYGLTRSSPQEILDAWAEDIHSRRGPKPKAATPPRKKDPSGGLVTSVVSPITRDSLEESNYLHEKYSNNNTNRKGGYGLWDDQDSVGDSSQSSYALNPLSRNRLSRDVSGASSVGSSVVTPPSQRVDESYDWPPPPTGSIKSQRESVADDFDDYYTEDDDYEPSSNNSAAGGGAGARALRAVQSDDTPETTMGRNKSLRLKIETFLVEPDCGFGNYTDEEAESAEPTGFYENEKEPHRILDDLEQTQYNHDNNGEDEYHGFDEDGEIPNKRNIFAEDDEDENELDGHDYGEDEYDDHQMAGIQEKLSEDEKPGYVPNKYQASSDQFSLTPEKKAPPPPKPVVTSPKILKTSSALQHYGNLLKDPAYKHAQQAGILWQNIVGQHVRFPAKWWNGARSPPMGVEEASQQGWKYVARHNVKKNPTFMKLVRNRSAPGRLLLHVVVRDLMTWKPVQDIVIGCFHPNARGIRKVDKADPAQEKCRDVWLAIRKRSREGSVSLIDPLLTKGKSLKKANDSPLGNRKAVTNVNMRAVFGDKPPLSTVYILESELYDKMREAEENASMSKSAALILLEEFLFQNRDAYS
mmetsp:Transcript_21109/g.29818  ORF Transcript_21109/g.29818 Transcript_21109/m.29818 type:complete len:739 (+) Transcript_21109:368-2584(+)